MSGFKKRFAQTFGTSPQRWIQREKAKKIYHEINCTLKSFKEIAKEYGFSSPAHFDKFCKIMYDMSPGALRESTKQRVLLN
jgi:AraC-like DNA-binding protein